MNVHRQKHANIDDDRDDRVDPPQAHRKLYPPAAPFGYAHISHHVLYISINPYQYTSVRKGHTTIVAKPIGSAPQNMPAAK
jgi:hypothetical protein